MSGRIIGGTMSPFTRVPPDIELTGIRAKLLNLYDELESRSKDDHHELSNNELLRHVLKNTDIEILLKTLGNAFTPRHVEVTSAPTQIVRPNRFPRGYIFLNPSAFAITTSVTVFASASRVAGTYDSANIAVANFIRMAAWLDVTVAGGTLTIALQTRDPLTLNFADAQTDIFGGFAAVGTRYTHLGNTGVDIIARFRAVVAGAAITFSLSAMLKEGLPGTSNGNDATIFLGPQDLNTISAYPLLPGTKEVFWLRENTPLFGRVTADPVTLRVFELQ